MGVNGLTVECINGPPSLSTVLEPLSCRYPFPERECIVHELKCTDMCKLRTCTNQKVEEKEEQYLEVKFKDTDHDGDKNN